MTHQESQLQKACISWFRLQYPHLARLITHPANEGNGNRVSGAIHKAEGTLPGVPDLLLFLPATLSNLEELTSLFETASVDMKLFTFTTPQVYISLGLGIEMKTEKGRLSESQKTFARFFAAAGYTYAIVRSLEDFQGLIKAYLKYTPDNTLAAISRETASFNVEQLQRDRDNLKKILNKKRGDS